MFPDECPGAQAALASTKQNKQPGADSADRGPGRAGQVEQVNQNGARTSGAGPRTRSSCRRMRASPPHTPAHERGHTPWRQGLNRQTQKTEQHCRGEASVPISACSSSWPTPTQRPARTHQIDLVGAVVRRPRYFRLDVRAPGQVEVAVTGAVLDHAGCLVTGVGRRIRSVENDLETPCPPHVT
jgi:hypothetical protein